MADPENPNAEVVEKVEVIPLASEGEVGDMVWDPVRGRHRKLAPWEPRPVKEGYEAPVLRWRDPQGAKPDDHRVRLMLSPTGVLVCGVLNRWGKWLVPGIGVVDPIAYAEVKVPGADDMPWRGK